MSAQKELVELNATTGHWSDETERKAAHWVDRHGPSIAELIEEASRRPNYNGASNRWVVTGFGIDIQFGSLLEAERFIHERIRASLRKLTEPKA